MSFKIILITIIVLFSSCAHFGPTSRHGILFKNDIVATPEDIIRLKVEAKRGKSIRTNLDQVKVESSINGTVIGNGTTNQDGITYITVGKLHKGQYTVISKISPSHFLESDSTSSIIQVIDKNQNIIIIDIDGTIATDTWPPFFMKDVKETLPIKDSVESLELLSKKYQIIYLTARIDNFEDETREWLDYWKFPKAPVYFWGLGGDKPLNRERYKSEVIFEIKKKFKNIIFGVGDMPHDMNAYAINDVPPIYIGDPKKKDVLPVGTQIIKTWKQILEQYQ